MAFCSNMALAAEGTNWWAAVFLKDGTDPEHVIREYRDIPSLGNHFKSWKDLMPDLVQLIDLNYVSMSIVMILVFGVVALGISCTFIIFILRNLREYGIMKAMGVSPSEMGLLIASEVVLMSLSACVIGIFLGSLAVMIWGHIGVDFTTFTSENRYFAVSGMIFPRLTVYSLLVPPALALFFGLLAAVWPMALIFSTVILGCAYRHYMGLHGPSMKVFSDIHKGVTEDKECLKCHHPEKNPEGPPTNHPHFTGCLKCHNDDL